MRKQPRNVFGFFFSFFFSRVDSFRDSEFPPHASPVRTSAPSYFQTRRALGEAPGDNALLSFGQDIQQLLQLQQLVLVPGHPLPSPAQFLLPQAQQGQQGGTTPSYQISLKIKTLTIGFNKPYIVRLVGFSFRTPIDTKSYSATSAKPREPAVRSWQNGTPNTGTRKETFIVRSAENQNLSAALSFPFSAAFLLSFPRRIVSCAPQRDKSAEVSSGGGMTTVPTGTSHPEEPSDLEELEQFARTFKQRRIKLGFTQVGRDTTCAQAPAPFAFSILSWYSSARET